MALIDQTIQIYRGEAIILPFTMAPVENIGGWTLRFTVTRAANKSTKILGPLPMIIDSAIDGTFHVTLSEEQTDLKPASYRFDVWRTDEGLEQAKAIGVFVILGNSRVPPVE